MTEVALTPLQHCQPLCGSGNSGLRPHGVEWRLRLGGPMASRRRTMPFDIWSDLALTALCGTALVTWIRRLQFDANRASRRIRQVRHRRTAHPLPSAPIPMLEFALEMPGGGVDCPLFAIARRAGPGACCPRAGARACAGAGLASRPLTLRRAEVSGQLQAFRLRQPKRAEGRRRPAWVPGHVR